MADIVNFPPRESIEDVIEKGWKQLTDKAHAVLRESGYNDDSATRYAEIYAAECRGYVAALESQGMSKADALKELPKYSTARLRELVGLSPAPPLN